MCTAPGISDAGISKADIWVIWVCVLRVSAPRVLPSQDLIQSWPFCRPGKKETWIVMILQFTAPWDVRRFGPNIQNSRPNKQIGCPKCPNPTKPMRFLDFILCFYSPSVSGCSRVISDWRASLSWNLPTGDNSLQLAWSRAGAQCFDATSCNIGYADLVDDFFAGVWCFMYDYMYDSIPSCGIL